MGEEHKESMLNDLDAGVCRTGKSGEVLEQNAACVKICGDRKGRVCENGCLDYFNEQNPSQKLRNGFHYFEGKKLAGEVYDILMLKRQDQMTTFLSPVAAAEGETMTVVVPESFTPREAEIFTLRMTERISVTEIAKKLAVSRATIRTHINNINKKLKQGT